MDLRLSLDIPTDSGEASSFECAGRGRRGATVSKTATAFQRNPLVNRSEDVELVLFIRCFLFCIAKILSLRLPPMSVF
jgi:hypothetical protein